MRSTFFLRVASIEAALADDDSASFLISLPPHRNLSPDLPHGQLQSRHSWRADWSDRHIIDQSCYVQYLLYGTCEMIYGLFSQDDFTIPSWVVSRSSLTDSRFPLALDADRADTGCHFYDSRGRFSYGGYLVPDLFIQGVDILFDTVESPIYFTDVFTQIPVRSLII